MTFTFSNDQEPLLEESGPNMNILDTSELIWEYLIIKMIMKTMIGSDLQVFSVLTNSYEKGVSLLCLHVHFMKESSDPHSS